MTKNNSYNFFHFYSKLRVAPNGEAFKREYNEHLRGCLYTQVSFDVLTGEVCMTSDQKYLIDAKDVAYSTKAQAGQQSYSAQNKI